MHQRCDRATSSFEQIKLEQELDKEREQHKDDTEHTMILNIRNCSGNIMKNEKRHTRSEFGHLLLHLLTVPAAAERKSRLQEKRKHKGVSQETQKAVTIVEVSS